MAADIFPTPQKSALSFVLTAKSIMFFSPQSSLWDVCCLCVNGLQLARGQSAKWAEPVDEGGIIDRARARLGVTCCVRRLHAVVVLDAAKGFPRLQ